MIVAYKKFWQNFTQYNGKATRSDYWWVFLVNSIIRVILSLVPAIVDYCYILSRVDLTTPNALEKIQGLSTYLLAHPTTTSLVFRVLGFIFSLAIMIPVTSLTARRLRDAGYNPAFAYPLIVVYIGNAISTFVTLPASPALTTIFTAYALFLLILCMHKSRSESDLQKF